MKRVKCELVSASPYSQSRFFQRNKSRDETEQACEQRTWIERAHWNEEGKMFIPPMSFKNCISEAAKYKSIQIPGKGKATYTKHFEAGVLVVEPLVLPITRDTILHEWLHVPADGRRGGTKRVERCFPLVKSWSGTVEFLIFDEIITPEVFAEHLGDAGKYIGIGRFRPRNNGFYGRFEVKAIHWS
jgi:hypothetical protein